jgi:hypothetical protein
MNYKHITIENDNSTIINDAPKMMPQFGSSL